MFKSSVVMLGVAFVAVLCLFSYQLGRSQAEIKYITQEKEVIRYEKKCTTNILVQPNVDDDAITRLFDSGRL
nr:MAG TPA: hypothetical protein [Caudoviricetes sp.]